MGAGLKATCCNCKSVENLAEGKSQGMSKLKPLVQTDWAGALTF